MNDHLGLVQVNLVIPRKENDSQWDKVRAEYKNIQDKINSELFTEGVVKEVCYLESHQLTFNFLGNFTPKNESDLLIMYSNSQAYYKNEIPRLVALTLEGYVYSLEIGTMKYTVI